MEIIAMTGQARCGKTHVAEYLCKLAFEAGATPHRVSFAGALKRASADAGFPKETHPKEYREFCQVEGAAKRAEDSDYWVNITMKEIKAIRDIEDKKLNDGDKFWEQVVIIDDVRYQNEIDAILRMGGTMAHVTAGDRLPVPHARFRRHESEKLAKAIDRTKGKGKRFEAYFQTVMPWGQPNQDLDVFWIDNSGDEAELERLLNASFGLMTNREQLTPETRARLNINQEMSDDEREEILDMIGELLSDLTDEERKMLEEADFEMEFLSDEELDMLMEGRTGPVDTGEDLEFPFDEDEEEDIDE